jgi:hypothetical protein
MGDMLPGTPRGGVLEEEERPERHKVYLNAQLATRFRSII